MIQRIQTLPKWARVIIFIAAIIGGVALLYGITVGVAWYGLNGTPRSKPVILQGATGVRDFAILPDDDSYPAALTLAQDGTLYTGSYVSGAVWHILPDGQVGEVPATRELFGSVSGMAITPDNTLYVLDRIQPLDPAGAIIWRMTDGNTPEKWVEIPAEEQIVPYDVALDADENLYLTVVIDGGDDYIARYAADGSGGVWWTAPQDATITGIAFDALNQRIIVSDTRQNVIYALSVASDTPQAKEIYRYEGQPSQPGFDGLTVGDKGEIYITALGRNRVAKIDLDTGELIFLAGAFRGSSRVAYDAAQKRLYVNNWDQRSLLPEYVLFVTVPIYPRLPFTIDMLELP